MVTPCQRDTKVSGKEGGTCVTLARTADQNSYDSGGS